MWWGSTGGMKDVVSFFRIGANRLSAKSLAKGGRGSDPDFAFNQIRISTKPVSKS
jgi:hypothetical protein